MMKKDTQNEAIQTLKQLMDKRHFNERYGDDAMASPADREGEWYIWAKDPKGTDNVAVVYMAGYNGNQHDDFEEGYSKKHPKLIIIGEDYETAD